MRRSNLSTRPDLKPGGFLPGWRILLVGFGFSLLATVCGFYLGFPNSALKQRLAYEIERNLAVETVISEASLWPILSLHATGIAARSPETGQDLLRIDSLVCSPLWRTLLTESPGVKGQLDSGNGSLDFRWQPEGPLAATAKTLAVDIPLATTPETRISALITSGQLSTSVPLMNDTESRLDLTVDNLVITGLEGLTEDGRLRLGRIAVQATGQGSSFTISRLESSGGDLIVSGNGNLVFMPAKPIHSRLNLNLSLRPGQQADTVLAGLVQLVGTAQPDGSRRIHLAGTLAKPIVN